MIETRTLLPTSVQPTTPVVGLPADPAHNGAMQASSQRTSRP